MPPGRLGIFHGMKSYFCQDEYGQIARFTPSPLDLITRTWDLSAHLHDIGRAEYVPVTDDEAVNAFEYLAKAWRALSLLLNLHTLWLMH